MQRKYKIALLGLLLIPCWVIGYRFGVDFVTLHYTAKLIGTNLGQVYEYTGAPGRYFYGPLSLVLIKPLGLLPYTQAKIVWLLIQTLGYLLFWAALYRLYPFLNRSENRWGWILVWIVAINPIHNNFQSSNIQLMLAVALFFGELLHESDTAIGRFLCGFISAIAASIKVFPLFLSTFYWFTSSRATRVGILAGFFTAFLIPTVFFGAHESMLLHQSFLTGLATYTNDNPLSKTPDILCLPSLLARTFSNGVEPTGTLAWVFKGIILAVAGGFLLFANRYTRKLAGLPARERKHLWALACALMVVLNPSTRPHYFMFLVPGFCSLFEILYREARDFSLSAGITISAILIAFTTEGIVGKHLNDRMELIGIPTMGMLLLCIVLVLALRRPRATALYV